MSKVQMGAAAQRIRLFVDENSQFWSPASQPAELFHYTSVEGFIGIVTSKTLWASDMLSLNDAAEASYATNLICDTLTAHHPEIPRADFETQLNYLFSLYVPFITCFCEDGDLLSQWRGYSDQGDGFAVGFSLAWLLSLKPKWPLIKVIYDREQQVDLILRALQLASEELNTHGYSEDEGVFGRSSLHN